MRPIAFAVPGDLDTPTGGYRYDRALIGALKALGHPVTVVPLREGFPFPDAAALDDAHAQIEAVPAETALIVDGLALGAMHAAPAGAAGSAARRARPPPAGAGGRADGRAVRRAHHQRARRPCPCPRGGGDEPQHRADSRRRLRRGAGGGRPPRLLAGVARRRRVPRRAAADRRGRKPHAAQGPRRAGRCPVPHRRPPLEVRDCRRRARRRRRPVRVWRR